MCVVYLERFSACSVPRPQEKSSFNSYIYIQWPCLCQNCKAYKVWCVTTVWKILPFTGCTASWGRYTQIAISWTNVRTARCAYRLGRSEMATSLATVRLPVWLAGSTLSISVGASLYRTLLGNIKGTTGTGRRRAAIRLEPSTWWVIWKAAVSTFPTYF